MVKINKPIVFCIVLLLFNVYAKSMEQIQQAEISSLKKLCLKELQNHLETTSNSNIITSLSVIPKELQKKCTRDYFCIQPTLTLNIDQSVEAFHDSSNTIAINSFPKKQIFFHCLADNDFTVHNNEPTIIMYKEGQKPHTIVMNNTHEIIFRTEEWNEKTDEDSEDGAASTYNLFNIATNSILYESADFIKSNSLNTFYLVEKNEHVTLYKKTNDTEHQEVLSFKNTFHELFSFNPNGKQLCVFNNAKNVCQLLPLTDEKSVARAFRANDISFHPSGKLAFIRTEYSKEKILHSVIDTATGNVLATMFIPELKEIFMSLDHFIQCNTTHCIIHNPWANDNTYIIDLKKLIKMNQENHRLLTPKLLVQANAAIVFNDKTLYTLHPTQKYVAKKEENSTWNLINIKTKKIVATLHDVFNFTFSSTGKMLCITYNTGNQEVFFLRNDFTAPEMVVHRLLQEKIITETDIDHNKDLSAMYEIMKTENKTKFKAANK